MRIGNAVSSRGGNYAKSRGRKIEVGEVSQREQVEKLEKLGWAVGECIGYITVPRDCA